MRRARSTGCSGGLIELTALSSLWLREQTGTAEAGASAATPQVEGARCLSGSRWFGDLACVGLGYRQPLAVRMGADFCPSFTSPALKTRRSSRHRLSGEPPPRSEGRVAGAHQMDVATLELEPFSRHVSGEGIANDAGVLLLLEVVQRFCVTVEGSSARPIHEHPELGIRREPYSATSWAKAAAHVVLRRCGSDSPWQSMS